MYWEEKNEVQNRIVFSHNNEVTILDDETFSQEAKSRHDHKKLHVTSMSNAF